MSKDKEKSFMTLTPEGTLSQGRCQGLSQEVRLVCAGTLNHSTM